MLQGAELDRILALTSWSVEDVALIKADYEEGRRRGSIRPGQRAVLLDDWPRINRMELNGELIGHTITEYPREDDTPELYSDLTDLHHLRAQ